MKKKFLCSLIFILLFTAVASADKINKNENQILTPNRAASRY